MQKKTILSLAFLFFFFALKAQYTQVGNGTFASFFYGPMATIDSTPYFNRHAYMYPSASIGNLQHGDTIRSIEFMRTGSDTLAGTANFRIYLKNSSRADFGSGSLNWRAEVRDSGMQLVFDDHPKSYIGSTAGLVRFDFSPGNYYVFDTTGAAIHLQVLVEYTQQTNQFNPIAWYNESSFTVTGFVSNNESKLLSGGGANWNDSLSTSSTQIKPTIRFNHPRHAQNLEVRNIYALGRVPLRMRTADTIKAIVQNIGLDTVTGHKVYLQVSGANIYEDSISIGQLAPYEQRMVRFDRYQPSNQGREVLDVVIQQDGDTSDNRSSKARLVNYNIYTHADPFTGNAGGIGFNGSTGDFVAKFYVNDSDYINQIKLDFSNSGRTFQLGIWEDDPLTGLPGTNVYSSDTLVSTAGTFILEVLPKVKIEGSFYVGIRQTSNTNVAFSYQPEVPVRPDVFFFAAPLGDTNWVPFSPGFNFNFNIQPRIQVGNDLSVVEILNPMDGADIPYSETDSLIPEVRVANYGALDQTNAVVEFRILNRFGQPIFTDDRIISLKADSQMLLQFDPFSLYNLGDFTAEATVNLNIDSVKDNNTVQSSFVIYKDHDVAADIIFEPGDGDSFEINTDGFWPQVRVFNYGRQTQSNFPVTARLRKGDQTLDSQQLSLSLNGEESQIVVFDSIFPSADGWLTFEAYTGLWRDSFPENDTIRVMVYGKKSHDIAAQRIIKPEASSKYATATVLTPFFEYRNVGFLAQDSILITAHIKDEGGAVVYSDSIWNSLNFFSTAQAIFKDFNLPLDPARLSCHMQVWIAEDQDRSNDTITQFFDVVNGRDLAFISIDSPYMDEGIPIGTTSRTVDFKLYNNGLVNAQNFQIELQVRNEDDQIVQRDSIEIERLEAGDTANLSIGQLMFDQGGRYQIILRNLWDDESELSSNDTAQSSYVVRYSKDLALIGLFDPAFNDSIQLNSIQFPGLEIENIGFDSLDGSWLIQIRDESNQLVFEDSLTHAHLQIDEQRSITTTLPFSPGSLGKYQFAAYATSLDDHANNDSSKHDFYVIKSVDISVDSALLPYEGEALLVKATHQPVVYVSNQGLEAVDDQWSISCQVIVNGNQVYFDQLDSAIGLDQVMRLQFDSSLRFPDPANALVNFITEHPMDVEPLNDTLSYQFIFSEKLSVLVPAGLDVMVYPNPFEEQITIRSTQGIDKIEVFSLDGKLISSQMPEASEAKLFLDAGAGTYLVKVYSGDRIASMRLVKTK